MIFSKAVEKSDLEELYLSDVTQFPDKVEYAVTKSTETYKKNDQETDQPSAINPNNLMPGGGTAVENGMGLVQWGLIGAFVLYFGSYGPDLFMAIMNPQLLDAVKTAVTDAAAHAKRD